MDRSALFFREKFVSRFVFFPPPEHDSGGKSLVNLNAKLISRPHYARLTKLFPWRGGIEFTGNLAQQIISAAKKKGEWVRGSEHSLFILWHGAMENSQGSEIL